MCHSHSSSIHIPVFHSLTSFPPLFSFYFHPVPPFLLFCSDLNQNGESTILLLDVTLFIHPILWLCVFLLPFHSSFIHPSSIPVIKFLLRAITWKETRRRRESLLVIQLLYIESFTLFHSPFSFPCSLFYSYLSEIKWLTINEERADHRLNHHLVTERPDLEVKRYVNLADGSALLMSGTLWLFPHFHSPYWRFNEVLGKVNAWKRFEPVNNMFHESKEKWYYLKKEQENEWKWETTKWFSLPLSLYHSF